MRISAFTSSLMSVKLGLMIIALLGFVSNASSQSIIRSFPSDAQLGTLSPSASPSIVINGVVKQLTVGAQIRDYENRIVQPMTLGGPDLQVVYRLSNQGQVDRMWILSNAELQFITNSIPSSMLTNLPNAVVVNTPQPTTPPVVSPYHLQPQLTK